ncbi:MAG: hypothetical protein ABW019_00480, partial [Chitinophagaceae bacterium]
RRPDYMVTVARFSGVDYEATIADFRKEIGTGQKVSIAVNDKNQVIAVVNHSTGEEGSLKNNSLTFSEIASTVFYVSIPCVLLYFIAQKAFGTVRYHDLGWVFLAVGALIVFFVVRGVGRQFWESSSALAKLKSG